MGLEAVVGMIGRGSCIGGCDFGKLSGGCHAGSRLLLVLEMVIVVGRKVTTGSRGYLSGSGLCSRKCMCF